MHSRFFLSLLFSFSLFISFSQSNPFLQRSLGSYGAEEAVDFVQTYDKGYAIAANIYWPSGGRPGVANGDIIDDSTTAYTSSTFGWIVKIDSAQNILWRHNIHEGTYAGLGISSRCKDVIETKDHGIIVIGQTPSGYILDSTNSWVIKFSSDGKLLWKYTTPTTIVYEELSEIVEMPDGSLAIAGVKNYNRMFIETFTHGWILVLNSDGSVKWDRSYAHNRQYSDLSFKTIDIVDGGFLVGGNKSDSYGVGNPDYYLFKTNFNGDSLWSKTYGGYGAEKLEDVLPLADGYLVTGTALRNDRDVVGVHCVNGASSCREDAWLLKVDKSGAILWQKAIGDVNFDYAGKLAQSANSYFITGSSTSDEYTPTKTRGGYDAWLLELDKNGNVINPRSFFGGTHDDYAVSILTDVYGGKTYPVLLCTTASETGDVEGFHDVPNQYGESDAWIFKLGYFNTIRGTIFYDLNKNGIKESNEPLFKRGIVKIATPSDSLLVYNSTGEYSIKVEAPEYNVNYQLSDSAFKIVPQNRKIQFPGYFASQPADFAVQLRPGISDISVSAFSAGRARPGFLASYEVLLFNRSGDTVRNKEFYFIKDSRARYSYSTPSNAGIRGDTMIFNYTNLKYSDTLRYTIVLNLKTPPELEINDTLRHLISAPLVNDADTTNNYVILNQLVSGSFDPNDKSEAHEGTITPLQASKGEYLNYLVRFQNTGTDTAFTVIVKDTVDKALDLSSLEMIKASHPYTLSIKNNVLQWKFANIYLPDSNSNEIKSHGYIAYKIRTRKNLVASTSIYNSASIYFDFNLPVKTNTTKTLIFDEKQTPGGGNSNVGNMLLVPNPAQGNVLVRVNSRYTTPAKIIVYDMAGRQMISQDAGNIEKDQQYVFSVPLHSLSTGIYNVVVYLGKNKIVQKLVIQAN